MKTRLERKMSRTHKPICYGKDATVLITKEEYGSFKIAIFPKTGGTIFSDWFFRNESYGDYHERVDRMVIEEVRDILYGDDEREYYHDEED